MRKFSFLPPNFKTKNDVTKGSKNDNNFDGLGPIQVFNQQT